MILAGDIGGTSVRLAYFERKQGQLVPIAEEIKHARDYPSLAAAVVDFRKKQKLAVTGACFGVAGPVTGRVVKASNLPWVIDAAAVEASTGIRNVHLINDLEANAWGLAELSGADFELLTPGVPGREGNAAVISAGTGLGEAGLFWDGTLHVPFAAEGGHADFGPANDLQAELWQYLHKKYGHVSWERVLSGPGQFNIYEFLRETGKGKEEPWLTEELKNSDDHSVVVTRNGLSAKSPLCEQAVNVFAEIYGAAAGNLALKIFAVHGVYVGGGIAPKILSKLREPRFMNAFHDKGRLRPFMESIPVRVVLNEKTALLGAAHVALMYCEAEKASTKVTMSTQEVTENAS